MDVFVNDAPKPTLVVDRLEGDATEGGLHLLGPASFANLVVTSGSVEGLSPEVPGDPLDGDRGVVRNWRLSNYSALPNGKDPVYEGMPGLPREWQAISAERRGLINISRVFGRPLAQPTRALAWLKTTITSDQEQSKRCCSDSIVFPY
ncbi:MAG: hypothetical protein QM757_18280 [Paludibaculum sp.]